MSEKKLSVVQYHIVDGITASKMATNVEYLLSKGYQPFGAPFAVFHRPSKDGYGNEISGYMNYCQAVVKFQGENND